MCVCLGGGRDLARRTLACTVAHSETVEDIEAYIEIIDENGNLEIALSENNEYVFQNFTIRASRKRVIRLKEIAAYYVGQCLSCFSHS